MPLLHPLLSRPALCRSVRLLQQCSPPPIAWPLGSAAIGGRPNCSLLPLFEPLWLLVVSTMPSDDGAARSEVRGSMHADSTSMVRLFPFVINASHTAVYSRMQPRSYAYATMQHPRCVVADWPAYTYTIGQRTCSATLRAPTESINDKPPTIANFPSRLLFEFFPPP